MADDYEDKTEQPTPKKLADARNKGLVAKSQDLVISFLLLLGMIVLYFSAGYMFERVANLSKALFTHINFQFDSLEQVQGFATLGLQAIISILLPLLLTTFLGALLFNLMQTGFIFSGYPIKPDWSRLNIFNGKNYEKMWSLQTLFRMGSNLVRFNLLVVINIGLMCLDANHLQGMSRSSAYDILLYIFKWTLIPGVALSMMFLILACFDYLFQHWRFNRQMRMSRREVKDEMRMLEGDELVRSRMRARMRGFLQVPLPKIISEADLLIADGGSYAVALKYDGQLMDVPVVIFKGTAVTSIEMRALATKFKVPIVENSFLAQALYRGVSLKKAIPPEHYLQVASALARAT